MALNPVLSGVVPHNMSMATLYVGDLHPDVTEAILFDKFVTAGPLISLHVCRDIVTRRSLGYAYVNFQNGPDAERALDTMNYDLIRGRPIRIMWSQRDPSLRRSGVGNIFIKNLDRAIDNKDLFDTFSAFGNIMSCKIAQTEAGKSKGYGFVHFETQEAADRAITKVNGMLLNGKQVYVGRFMARIDRDRLLGEKHRLFTNVYVKNYGDQLDEDTFVQIFAKYGTIASHKMERHEDGSAKGFGFVAYKEPKAAEQAVRSLNGVTVADGVALYVGRAQKRVERQEELRRKYEQLRRERYTQSQGSNLYVKNLDDGVDEERLRKEFGPFGTITSVTVMRENGRSKGFGFVCYTTPEEATRAVTEMGNRLLGSKPIYVALAQRKEDRKVYLSALHANRMAHFRAQQSHFLSGANGFYAPQMLPLGRYYGQPLIAQVRAPPPAPRWPSPLPVAAMHRPYRVPALPGTARSILARPLIGGQEAAPLQPHHPASLSATNAPVARNRNLQQHRHPALAAKITGMLLEIDNCELTRMLDDTDCLQEKLTEAVAVLEAMGYQQPVEAAQ